MGLAPTGQVYRRVGVAVGIPATAGEHAVGQYHIGVDDPTDRAQPGRRVDGGLTNITDETLACPPHNRLVTEGGWRTRKRKDDRTEWIPPPHLDTGQPRVNRYHHPQEFLADDKDEDDEDTAVCRCQSFVTAAHPDGYATAARPIKNRLQWRGAPQVLEDQRRLSACHVAIGVEVLHHE